MIAFWWIVPMGLYIGYTAFNYVNMHYRYNKPWLFIVYCFIGVVSSTYIWTFAGYISTDAYRHANTLPIDLIQVLLWLVISVLSGTFLFGVTAVLITLIIGLMAIARRVY